VIGGGTLHSSDRQDWQTPDDVLDVVRQVAPIALDPCTTPDNPTGAQCWIAPTSPLGCGLTHSRGWSQLACGGLVYVNPPYGRECAVWVNRCVAEGSLGLPIVLLVAARPGSRWGQRLLASADAVCFWRGRIKFRGATAGAPFDSLFAAWNCRARFEDAFAPHGTIMERVR